MYSLNCPLFRRKYLPKNTPKPQNPIRLKFEVIKVIINTNPQLAYEKDGQSATAIEH